jgi:serine/threonine protein kinase
MWDHLDTRTSRGSKWAMRVCLVCDDEYDDTVQVCPVDGAATSPKGTKKKVEEDPYIGRMVGSYKLTRVLGKGGMGSVYAGEHPAIGSKVAVKFLLPQYSQDRAVVTRFFNEAKAVNLIKHDNIVQVIDFSYLDENTPCFVMEYLDQGYSLSSLVGKPLGLEITGPILIQCCDALAAAHDKQIIHRDLKPDNVFLSVKNRRKHFVKLMDFGIAKIAATEDQSKTQTGVVMGTPAYMSPEQASGNVNAIGPGSDIYSIGIIMYLLATGEVPFKGGYGEVMAGHLFKPPRPPRELVPLIPPAYEAVILKALAKKPEERFPSMRDLIRAIDEVMTALHLSMDLPLVEDTDHLVAAAGGSTTGVSLVNTSGIRAAAAAATRRTSIPPPPPGPAMGPATVNLTPRPSVATAGTVQLPPPLPDKGTAGASAGTQVVNRSDVRADAADAKTQFDTSRPPLPPAAALTPEPHVAHSEPVSAAARVSPGPAVAAEALAKRAGGRRMAMMVVAFLLGVAAPIAMVKSGMVGPRAAISK